MFYVNVIKTYRDVIAICDEELLGKKFEEGEFQLDVKESFYKGENLSEKETEQTMKNFSQEDATFNIVGEKSIALAIKANIISEDNVRKIQGIPHALLLM
jgi:uncharacterized protein